MPEGCRIADSIINPSSVPWLQRALVKLEAADLNRAVIDHRKTLPKVEDTPEIEQKRSYKTSNNKLFLSDEDKEHFAELVYQFRLHHSGWGWQRILNEANKEMPAHKQRHKMPPTPSQIPWLPPLLDKIGSRLPVSYTPEPEPIVAAPPPVAAPAAGLEDAMITMMANMFKQMMPQVMNNPETQQKLQQAMLSPTGSAPAHVEQRPQRRKVVVVGLLPIQTQETQRDFGRVFDFKFISSSNTPSQQIRDAAKNADIAIIMTQFVSHSTQAALRAHPGFTYCNGNSTALKHLLEEMVSGVKVGQ